ncbi:TIGR04211 family SH3 domain-containing protein [Algiphilus sp. W345]|uniref:TIGR04211 family SH3 domain-containing protein n=1 Tax=Banduia mediterranea TaxID=3075609 RepID=A0ABU2WG11_9GAMM|nr:TIGR04211 family SH3 domain-containing protein [Algiphilus sp. W345]MDT0496796.1 TIGR04211 family SH3 domain-containing protein [Algiphilus sp. W345]
MKKLLLLAALVVCAPLPFMAQAQDDGVPKYVSDEILLSVRERPSNDAGTIGVIHSGDRVTLLRSLGEQSYSQIRTADGVTGWVTSRYLSDEPAAEDQLDSTQTALRKARDRVATLEANLDEAQTRLDSARPAFELQEENDKLRAVIAENEQRTAQLARRFNQEKAKRQTMVMGAALVGGGVLLGLVLPWIGRGRKRRAYGDL